MYSFVSSLFLLQQVNKFVYLKLYLYVAPCPGSSGHVKGGQSGTERFGLVVEDIINAERELYLIKEVLRHVQVAQGICRQSCSHPGGAPYRVSPHLHRSARRSRCGTSSISGKGRKQRYSYLPHRTRLCRFCSNPAPSGRGYLPDGSLNQKKENQSP